MARYTREEQITSIRQLADWLEQHPEVPVPYNLNGDGYVLIMTMHQADDQKSAMAAIARALPGKVNKVARDGDESAHFEISGRVGCITVEAVAYRKDVCERVVVGRREVTEEITDPAAPTITVTRTVEDVQWVCGPLLREAAES